jgi:hypothetical protein
MLSMDDLFKGRQFDREIIVLCVRWYLWFKHSFRDPVEMLAERGISLAHTTIMRWIQRYVPEFERRCNRFARPRVDLGVSTKPTSRSRAVGRIFIVRSTKRQDYRFSAARKAGCRRRRCGHRERSANRIPQTVGTGSGMTSLASRKAGGWMRPTSTMK